jgi:hypothetical protein
MDYVFGTLANTCGTVIIAKIWLEYTENGQTGQTVPETVSSTGGAFRYRIPSIRGQATIYAENLSGDRVSKAVSLDGNEQHVSLQLCMELAGLLVTADDETGKSFSLAEVFHTLHILQSRKAVLCFIWITNVNSIPNLQYSRLGI